MPTQRTTFRLFTSGFFASGFFASGAIACIMLLSIAPRAGAQGVDRVVYEQPLRGEFPSRFSNINSSFAEYLRLDDFVAPRTGYVSRVTFWGKGWDVLNLVDCDLNSSLDFIVIDFYTWMFSSVCGWLPVDRLHRFVVPWVEVEQEYVNPTGNRQYRFTANLPLEFEMHRDLEYGLIISGVLSQSTNPCVFAWSSTADVLGGQGYSVDLFEETCFLVDLDQAFALHMDPLACPGDIDNDDVTAVSDLLSVIGAWGPCELQCIEDIDASGAVDVGDLLGVISTWGPCP